MATVPTQFVPRVQGRGAGLVPASTDTAAGAFGQGIARSTIGAGREIGRAADQLGNIAVQMAEEDNETAAKQADTRMADRMRSLLLGDPNDAQGTPGYLNTRGETTLGTYGDAEKALRAIVAEEVEGATNPQVAQMITNAGNRRLGRSLDRMTGHAAEQRLVTQENASLARESAAYNDVVADWQSDEVLNDSLAAVQAEVLDRAEARGAGEDETAAMLTERQSVVIKGGFDAALASGNVNRAQAIFSQHADKLDGATRTTMAEALAQDVQSVTAQALADEALLKYPNDPAAQRKFIRDAAEGKQESLAIQELNNRIREYREDTRFGIAMRNARDDEEANLRQLQQAARATARFNQWEKDRVRTEKRRTALADAHVFIANGGTSQEWRAQNPEAFNLIADQADSLLQYERRIAEGTNFAVASDGETMTKFRLQSTNELSQYTDGDLLQLQKSLTRQEFNEAQRLVVAARSKVQATREAQRIYDVGERALKEYAPDWVDTGKNANKRSKDALAVADNMMMEWIDQNTQEGKLPTRIEVERYAARLMTDIKIVTGWMDEHRDFEGLAAQAHKLPDAMKAIAIVPFDNIRQGIKDRLKRMVNDSWKGITYEDLSEDAIEELAGAAAMNDPGRMERILRESGGKPRGTQ